MKKLLVTIIVLAAIAGGAYYAWKQGLIEIPGAPGAELTVPIDVRNANGVGALHIELVYDPAALEIVEVKAGKLAKGGMLESSLKTPGRATIGIVHPDGIRGTGPVVALVVKPKGGQAKCALTLENVTAHDAASLHRLVADTTAGQFAAGAPTPPAISFPGE